MREPDLDRLLRAAADARDEAPAEMPFGFDTRVLARARGERSGASTDALGLMRFFRRIATAASIVAVCAGAAAFWQLRDSDELDETTANAYAMADTVIEAASWQ